MLLQNLPSGLHLKTRAGRWQHQHTRQRVFVEWVVDHRAPCCVEAGRQHSWSQSAAGASKQPGSSAEISWLLVQVCAGHAHRVRHIPAPVPGLPQPPAAASACLWRLFPGQGARRPCAGDQRGAPGTAGALGITVQTRDGHCFSTERWVQRCGDGFGVVGRVSRSACCAWLPAASHTSLHGLHQPAVSPSCRFDLGMLPWLADCMAGRLQLRQDCTAFQLGPLHAGCCCIRTALHSSSARSMPHV